MRISVAADPAQNAGSIMRQELDIEKKEIFQQKSQNQLSLKKKAQVCQKVMLKF